MIERRLVSLLMVAVVFAATGCIEDPAQLETGDVDGDVGVADATDDECPGDNLELCDVDGKETCVDIETNPDHCGNCADADDGTACDNGTVCVDGDCQVHCPEGLQRCGDECIDPLNDPENCGGCEVTGEGDNCADGDVCHDGVCESECPADRTECDGGCVDTGNNSQHCGGCTGADANGEGQVCGEDQVCNQGECQFECPAGLTECGETCVDTANNPDYCGGCTGADANGEGEVCGEDQVCAQGECELECPSELTECNGACVDTANNPDYCGGCPENGDGTVCGDDQSCFGGQCMAVSCPDGLVECGDECVDTDDSDNHCGICDNECETDVDGASAGCDGGACIETCDSSDLTLCDGECVDTDDNAEHCGGCNVGCVSGDCEAGICQYDEDCDPEDEVTEIGDGDFDGDGPHLICSAAHLEEVDDYSDRDFLVVDDIDFEDDETFEDDDFDPIDDFSGTFRGDGYTVENLSVDTDSNAGLFADTASDAEITDLRLVDVDIDGESRVGALVGANEGDISNVEVDGGTIDGSSDYVGGLVGYHAEDAEDSEIEPDQAVITDARAEGIDVYGDGDSVGGLVGLSEGDIDGSFSSGVVEGTGEQVGGLVGRLRNGATLSSSSSSVDVTGHDERIGGLLGSMKRDAILEDSHASGEVVSEGGDKVGGLVGRVRSRVSDSYAVGDVTADGDRVGGLVGRVKDDEEYCLIENSWAGGDVVSEGGGEEDESYGGLIGELSDDDCDVIDSRAAGDVIASPIAVATTPRIDKVGGLVGLVDDENTISGSTATGDVSGNEYVGGLVGYVDDDDGTIEESRASGTVVGMYRRVGGLVGRLDGSLEDSSATGNVSGVDEQVGGLIGRINSDDARVESSYATGDVWGDEKVGGLVGEFDDGEEILNSYATGDVSGNEYVGGLVGENDEDIRRTYSAGFVDGETDVGGLVGDDDGDVESSFWDVETSGQSSSDGDATGLETEEFEDFDRFDEAGWDIATGGNSGDISGVYWYLAEELEELQGLGGDEDNIRPRLLWEFDE